MGWGQLAWPANTEQVLIWVPARAFVPFLLQHMRRFRPCVPVQVASRVRCPPGRKLHLPQSLATSSTLAGLEGCARESDGRQDW